MRLPRISKGEIFVIDDDASTREMLSKTLEERGYDVISFADGASLLSYVKARTPACMFVEVARRPTVPGFELLEKAPRRKLPGADLRHLGARAPSRWRSMRSGTALSISSSSRSAAGRSPAGSTRPSTNIASRRATTMSPRMSLYVPGCEPLTGREREVLARIAVGETNKETARQLGPERANRRRLSGQHHAQGRRQERGRTAPPCLQPGPAQPEP